MHDGRYVRRTLSVHVGKRVAEYAMHAFVWPPDRIDTKQTARHSARSPFRSSWSAPCQIPAPIPIASSTIWTPSAMAGLRRPPSRGSPISRLFLCTCTRCGNASSVAGRLTCRTPCCPRSRSSCTTASWIRTVLFACLCQRKKVQKEKIMIVRLWFLGATMISTSR